MTTDPHVLCVDGRYPAPAAVAEASQVLWGGALIVFPTDTLYAVGGRAWDECAARLVIALKRREAAKALPLVAADVEQAQSLCATWPPAAALLAGRFWPGPLSLVLPACREVVDEVLGPAHTVAVRVPACKCTRSLCALAGPLIATSANRAGEPPPEDCLTALRQLGTGVALGLDVGRLKAPPSTLVDLSTSPPSLLRAGAIEWEDVVNVLRAAGLFDIESPSQ
jgi:L-threonylcarbamoyladenylate synthase